MPTQSQMPPVAQFSLPSQGQQNNPQPNTQPSPASSQMPPVAQFSLPGATQGGGQSTSGSNWVEDAGNFLFPAVGDAYNDLTGQNTKTALQQAGDVGLSVLPFIPGLGEVGEGARAAEVGVEGASDIAKSGGLLSKLKGLPTAVKGAGVGYSAGVASNLSQGQGIGQALTPNLANIGGAVTGGLAGALVPKIAGLIGRNTTEEGAVSAVQNDLRSEISRNVPGKTLLQNLPDNGSRALNLISRVKGALPEVSGNNFNIEEPINTLESRIAQLGQTRAEAISKFAPETSIDELAAQAKAGITTASADATPAEQAIIQRRLMSGEAGNMSNKIDTLVQNIKADNGGKTSFSAPEIEALKEAMSESSGIYKRTGAIADQNAASLLGGAAKDKMESLASQAGFPGMQEYNQVMKDHYDAIKVLQRLGKQTVKGGRLGKALMSHTAGVIGATAGSALGGGFLGTLAGGAAGEGAGQLIGKIIGDTSLSNPLRDAVLSKIQQEDPSVVQKLMQFAGKTGEKVAPIAVPKVTSKTASMIPGLLTKTAARAGSAL